MGKKFIICVLLVLMFLGIGIAIANFISVQVHAGPCILVAYYPNVPDCFGAGTGCYDCTLKPKD